MDTSVITFAFVTSLSRETDLINAIVRNWLGQNTLMFILEGGAPVRLIIIAIEPSGGNTFFLPRQARQKAK